MSSDAEYDRNSHDAVITEILTRLGEQDRTMMRNHSDNQRVMSGILDQVTRTNGRVSALEKWKWMMTGALGLISFVLTILATVYAVHH
jgi:hypothetical protein